ncbi:unnamed protein product [Diatraea saccharalis]|uniref:Uncharacterized protein n=1 Tax=Diatraea saccharalis TaxID=40085 RepID=A0A9N9QUU5_9NEOP|nr:unnamed protein product [Diatraea saccharalis]
MVNDISRPKNRPAVMTRQHLSVCKIDLYKVKETAKRSIEMGYKQGWRAGGSPKLVSARKRIGRAGATGAPAATALDATPHVAALNRTRSHTPLGKAAFRQQTAGVSRHVLPKATRLVSRSLPLQLGTRGTHASPVTTNRPAATTCTPIYRNTRLRRPIALHATFLAWDGHDQLTLTTDSPTCLKP